MTANTQKDTVPERSAWIAFIVVGAIFGLFGVSDMVLGMNADPAIAESIAGIAWEELQASDPRVANLIDMYVRSLGAGLLVVSILSLTITLTAFKRGERWSWYALWVWPLWNVAIFGLSFTAERQPGFPPPPMISSPVFFLGHYAGLDSLLPQVLPEGLNRLSRPQAVTLLSVGRPISPPTEQPSTGGSSTTVLHRMAHV